MNADKMIYETNPALQRLKQPLTEEEYCALEEDIFDNGCSTPLLVWGSYIIDGCSRYNICRLWNLPFTVEYHPFKELADAVSFVCQLQLSRRDLTAEMRKYLIGRQYYADVDICVREFLQTPPKEYLETHHTLPVKPYKKYETAYTLGSRYRLAASTVLKYSRFAKNMDQIYEKEEELAARILSSELKISLENTGELAKLNAKELTALKKNIDDSHTNQIRYHTIQQGSQRKNIPAVKKFVPQIRSIPAYDPDAEVSSLTLTIPSWISSVTRVGKNTAPERISPAARQRLKAELTALKTAADHLYRILEEKKNDDAIRS